MSLRANILNQGDVAIIALEGKLDFESQDILRENIITLMREGKQVIVDMDNLSFVGSSGITHFIRSLYEMQEMGGAPRLCNVRSEFRQIINAYDTNKEFSIHGNREDAVNGFFRSGQDENN